MKRIKRVIVTGGAGFIGSALIRYLLAQTNQIVMNLDKLTYAGNLNSLAALSHDKRYFFQQVDICNRNVVRDIFESFQPDAVMHLAAESHVDRSIDNAVDFIQTNVVGTFSLLEETRNFWNKLSKDKQKTFRFHHVSTDEVFGTLGSTGKFTEQSPYRPNSPYSATKAASDHLVRAWYETYGLPIIISNCSNNYGPYHFPEKLIPHMILNALHGRPLPIYGNGHQVRDWLYVDDHVRALYTILTQGKLGETYNVGGHNEQKNIDVVRAICEVLETLRSTTPLISHQHRLKDLITYVDDRPGHDVRYAIDATKIARDLGWQPQETFESGLHKTVHWYLKNEAWWQDILNGTYRLNRLGAVL